MKPALPVTRKEYSLIREVQEAMPGIIVNGQENHNFILRAIVVICQLPEKPILTTGPLIY
jgi:hypothetical protein